MMKLLKNKTMMHDDGTLLHCWRSMEGSKRRKMMIYGGLKCDLMERQRTKNNGEEGNVDLSQI